MENRLAISSDLIRGHIDTIILHCLIGGDKSAQQISDSVEEKSSGEYKINQATLYSSLKRLETLKLVSSYWNDYSDGRRKYFAITDLGKQTVKDNLSSWTYSRSIIDKLMDLQPVQSVESVPYQPAIAETVVYQEHEKIQEKPSEISENIAEKPEEHEINFRNILNGLVQIAAVKHENEEKTPQNTLKPIIKDDLPPKNAENPVKPEVMKFNETIAETDYNANKSNYNGRIDYGDLTLKAQKEGYVIKISSKDSAKSLGETLINKVNFAAYFLVFMLVIAECCLLYPVFSGVYSSPLIIALAAVSALPLIAFAVVYFSAKNKLSKKILSADGILTAAIVAFNLILITLAIDFLLEIDFADKYTLLAALVIPIMYYIDFVAFFAF
nr:PadR family transcriptional regulator [Clostridia bacterium]